MKGKKFDQGKLKWDLLPLESVEEIIKVLMFGEEKYGKHNWQELDKIQERYYNAAMRHLSAWKKGEKLDKESGLPHLAHAGCCLLFMLYEKEK